MVECLPLDPAAQVRFPPRAVGIFLHPVTFANSVNPDETAPYEPSHQDFHCLLS